MATSGRRAVSRILTYLVLIAAALVTLVPLGAVFLTAIRPQVGVLLGPFSLPDEISLQNFYRAWVTGRFSEYFTNSMIITVSTVAIVLTISSFAGYSFAKIRFPFRDLFFYVTLIGMMVPFQAIMIPLYFLMDDLRLLDTFWSVILTLSAAGIAFGIFMMRSFFRGLPNELIESARMDGAADLTIFARIMLPLTSPALVALLIFQTMWSWNNFIIPLVFIHDRSMRPIPLALMHFQSQYETNYALLAAAVLIGLSPLLVMYILLQRKVVTGLTMGAIKG